MAEILSIDNLFTLFMLVLLQAVLGFDNLLYISIESKRVEESKQQIVRKIGILLAIGLRIVLIIFKTRCFRSTGPVSLMEKLMAIPSLC